MIITTDHTISGKKIISFCGEVGGEVRVDMPAKQELTFLSGADERQAREAALAKMKAAARELGANAIVDFKDNDRLGLDAMQMSSPPQNFAIVKVGGTAVKIK